jgi:multidrug efflux pump subunit AcrA (membrane-fusion protein)
MIKKKYIYPAAAVILIPIAWWLIVISREGDTGLFATVTKGTLNIEVTATGELTAKSAVMVHGPSVLATLLNSDIKLQSILPEGTNVKRGDVIAELDPKGIKTLIRQAEESSRDGRVKLEELILDTTQTLKDNRDQIMNLEFDLEQAKTAVIESTYEVPATKSKLRQDSIKAGRMLENAKAKYTIEKTKAGNRVRNARFNYDESIQLLNELKQTLDSLIIRAPSDGMLIYHRNAMGDKVVPGSSLAPTFDFIVAELPDLSQMKSVTGINEIDIDKVHTGQPVSISVDASPGKIFNGHVIEVANMGMTDPASGSKVFDVEILLDDTHAGLRPGMTSKNSIVTGTYRDVLYIPVDAVFTREGTSNFVYKKRGSGVTMQPVVTGPSNAVFIIIKTGLSENDKVSLSEPD